MSETATVKKLSSAADSSLGKVKSLAVALWRFLTFSPADDLIMSRSLLSVSIEKGIVSVASGRKFLSRINLRGAKEYPVGSDRYPYPLEVVSAVASAAREWGAEGGDIVLSIPKSWTIIRTVELPSSVKENISDVVTYELDRLTPLGPDEAFYDFKVLKDAGDKISILIFAAKAASILPYCDALRDAGFVVSSATFATANISALCNYIQGKEDCIIIRIDGADYEGAVSVNGSLVHLFSDKLPEDRDAAAAIIASKVTSVADRNSGGKPAHRIVLYLRDKDTSLRDLLKLRMPSPCTILEDSDIRTAFKGSWSKLPPEAVGGVLASLWQKPDSINLLSKGKHRPEKRPYALTIVLLLAIAASLIFYLLTPLKIEGKRLRHISRQIESRKDEVRKVEAVKKEVDSLSAEIASINGFKEESVMMLTLMKDLTAILPSTSWLTRVRITDTVVETSGYASSATELLPRLESSEYFRKVEFASPTVRDATINKDRFVIKMSIGTEQTEAAANEKK